MSWIAILRESWGRFLEFVPGLRRPAIALGLLAVVKVGVLLCLAAGWWLARGSLLRAMLIQAAYLLWTGAWWLLGFWPRRAAYRQRFGPDAYNRLFWRFFVWGPIGGVPVLFFPLLVGGQPLLPPGVAYALSALSLLSTGLLAWRGKELYYNFDLRCFVYTVFPERGPVLATGIFRWLRHPVYSAFIRWMVGFALLRNNAAALVCAGMGAGGLWVLSRVEESDLVQRDPSYAQYRRETPAFLYPWPFRFWRFLLSGM